MVAAIALSQTTVKPPKYRFRDGLHPATAEDFKLNPDAFIDCRQLSGTEQAKLCRERANMMCQRLSAYKQRGTAVFSGTVVQFEQEIVKEEAWAAYLETPLSAKTLLKEPKSKTKPLFPNSERNVGPPDTLTDDRPFAYMPPKKEKLSFEGLVREKLEFISKIGISKKGVYYIVYKTSRVTSCQFVSAAKLLKAFADIQKFRKGWDLTMNSMIACCDGKAVTMIKFIFTKAWEPEKLERTKIDVATLAPFLVDWSNRVNGFISPVKHVPLPNPTSKSTALKTPGIFQSKTARYKEECARSRERMIETRSEQWAMLAEIRKHPGLPEKLMELQSAAKKTGLKVGLGLSLQPFCASIVTQEGECLGNIALSIQSSFPWVVKMEDARRLATASLSGEEIPVTSALEGLVVLKEPQQLALDF